MPQTPLASPSEEQQEKLLDDALGIVKVQSFQMKCCLDKAKLMEALKHASNMLSELRTSLLSPKSYYELYMYVTDQLRHLELYLVDEFQRGRKMADLYELVQYAGNIIPRLYLLITVGLVYMKTTPGCRRDILKDLVEMCRGVQHPLRGLFLRNYLLQSCRNVLPDVDVEEVLSSGDVKEDHPGTVQDSIDFILLNFAEMNKLWVRMQHQGHTREKDRRERERLELRLLVGTNLVRLSQLDSVDLDRYNKVVLPGILEQVVSCRDAIAQEYLMECLIQVFPDEFHLATLQAFLNSCAQLAPSVNVRNIIIALIDRLASSKDILLPDDLFDIFSQQISNIIQTRENIPLEDIILMQGSLINFSMKKISTPEKKQDSMNSVIGSTLQVIRDKSASQIVVKSNLGKELLKFLKLPINMSNDDNPLASIKISLRLTNYKEILKETCSIQLHKQITLTLLNYALDSGSEDNINQNDKLTPDEVTTFLSHICHPLIDGGTVDEGDENDEDFVDEQILLSRFLHFLFSPKCIASDELDTYYLLLASGKKILSSGGGKRIRYTYPSVVFEALKLSIKYSEQDKDVDPKWEKKCSKIFQFIHQTISAIMKESNSPELCLKLFLQAALNANQSGIDNRETIAYEFVSQAFAIYEEEISDSKTQLACLQLIICTVKKIDFKNEENFQPLRSQCCLNAAKLVKKSDQCRAVMSACMLFLQSDVPSDSVKCVRRAVKITSTVLDSELQLQLFVEILAHLTLLVHYHNKDIVDIIRGLITKIEEQKKETTMSELIQRQYTNNLAFLKQKQVITSDE